MSKIIWQTLKAAPAVLIASLMVGKSTIAAETQSKIAAEANLNQDLLAQTLNNPNNSNSQILEQIDLYNKEAREQGQIVNVFQLRDVSPGDWAFEALRSLVERYGCIVGYPDRTFRGNRALTRYEFAAGLNACLNQIERLIAASEAVLREDIDRLQRLIEEFEAELAALGVRIDDLEGRVAFLEDNQFSTTTKLVGETIIGASVAGGGDKANSGQIFTTPGSIPPNALVSAPINLGQPNQVNIGEVLGQVQNLNEAANFLRITGIVPNAASVERGFLIGLENEDSIDDELVLYQRTRLNLNTSFTGRDRLLTRLQARNVPNFGEATGTNAARLGFDGDDANDVRLSKLWYRLPINDNITFHLAGAGVDFDDISDPKNPFFESSGTGALGRFGRFNPAIFRLGGSATIGANLRLNDFFGVDVAYLTSVANDPTINGERALFNGDYAAAVQVNITPSERFEFGLAYARSYSPLDPVTGELLVPVSDETGSRDADNPFAHYELVGFDPITNTAQVNLVEDAVPVSANRFGFQGTARIAERFNVNAWFGYVDAIAERNPILSDFQAVLPGVALTAADAAELDRILDAGFREGDGTAIINGAIGLALLDVGREGSVIGLIAGIPPYALDRDTFGGANDVPIYIEGHYRFPITRNILITPGIHAVINPEQNEDNDAVFVGTIRTTFRF